MTVVSFGPFDWNDPIRTIEFRVCCAWLDIHAREETIQLKIDKKKSAVAEPKKIREIFN